MAPDLILALAIQRLPLLRPDEKILLWDLIDDPGRLAVLSLSDVEVLVGRRLRGGGLRDGLSGNGPPGRRPWDPAAELRAAEADLRFLGRAGARYVHFDDPDYPPLLRETSRPPFGLYLRGSLWDPCLPAAAVVGTRCPTSSGAQAAASLAGDLAEAGIPVVSGLARGIDAAAHRGSLSRAGITCAVLPCGIDAVYPAAHKGLALAILEGGGALVSEYPPGTEIRRYRFPERNRIIAGMARACVVVEAPAGSGALITADHALSEGRDVWVCASRLGGPRSAGLDGLAEEGACLLDGAGSLLADWGRRPDSAGEFAFEPAADSDKGEAVAGRLAAAARVELGLRVSARTSRG
jgi:DNA processing protein